MNYSFISVDLQNDFTSDEGKHYETRPSIDFLKETLFPFLKEENIKVSEIISDYRQPRPGDKDDSCNPGTWGYKSIVPKEIIKSQWVKCMNSPIWIRYGIGDPDKKPGTPYQDTEAFGEWLKKNVGEPDQAIPVLFGLTVDCCVLSTIQELNWRGYRPVVIEEGVDHYDGTEKSKEAVIGSAITNWAKIMSWDEVKEKLRQSTQ